MLFVNSSYQADLFDVSMNIFIVISKVGTFYNVPTF